MPADQYLQQLLAGITAPTGASGPGPTVLNGLRPVIQQWATTQLNELQLSGSYVKDTAIIGGTDVDLFISLKSDTSQTLREIYGSFGNHMQKLGYSVRRQNVAIGITYRSWKVDLTPGKQQQPWSTNHSIWVSRQRTWQMTNINRHVQTIGGSAHTDVIRLMKRWRKVHSLEFLSFAVELAVLRGLQQTSSFTGLASRFNLVLEFLRDRIGSAQLIDPANSNNNVANELTAAEKTSIATQAWQSRNATHWQQVVW
jgi:tRNA nucleotidyltransferase (CCA-adding enzyme)